jgi:hypothetical protein
MSDAIQLSLEPAQVFFLFAQNDNTAGKTLTWGKVMENILGSKEIVFKRERSLGSTEK